jgi:hypothetical protein
LSQSTTTWISRGCESSARSTSATILPARERLRPRDIAPLQDRARSLDAHIASEVQARGRQAVVIAEQKLVARRRPPDTESAVDGHLPSRTARRKRFEIDVGPYTP